MCMRASVYIVCVCCSYYPVHACAARGRTDGRTDGQLVGRSVGWSVGRSIDTKMSSLGEIGTRSAFDVYVNEEI